jgi:hypothetical protein
MSSLQVYLNSSYLPADLNSLVLRYKRNNEITSKPSEDMNKVEEKQSEVLELRSDEEKSERKY